MQPSQTFKLIELAPVPGALGAEIVDLDLCKDLTEANASELREALQRHLVLFARGQRLTAERQIALAAAIGVPQSHSFIPGLSGAPQVTEIRKEPGHQHNFGGAWHFDSTFLESPPVGAVLHAKEVPNAGGDTLWSNQYLAYDTLSQAMREMVGTLRAAHSSQLAFGAFDGHGQTLSAEHPLAPVHTGTGKRHLFANPVSTVRINGITPRESEGLLEFLFRHAVQEEFTYRHRWREGDVVIWDNRATMHRALNDYHGQRRVVHRVSIGERTA